MIAERDLMQFATQYLAIDLPTHLTKIEFDFFLRRNMLPMLQSIETPPTLGLKALLKPDCTLEAENMRGKDCACFGRGDFDPQICDDWRKKKISSDSWRKKNIPYNQFGRGRSLAVYGSLKWKD